MSLGDIGGKLRRAGKFVLEDMWDLELTSLTRVRAAGVKALRVVYLVFRGFRHDECPLHASALTFSTLIAIVPILALSLAMARGLGGAETAKNKIRNAVSDWTERFGSRTEQVQVVGTETNAAVTVEPDGGPGAEGSDELSPEDLAEQINSMVEAGFEKVENVSFTGLNAVGIVLLIWMSINVLGRVESSFNRVWGVTVGRSLWRKFTDYLSVLFILPILAMAATSVSIADFATRFVSGPAAGRMEAFLVSGMLKNLTAMVMTSLCFSFVIMFMPNTKVKAKPALAGGAVAALLFLGWMWVCASFQVGAARAGRIYGSFAFVPILLMWVYVSWQIVLFGAETAFAVQNCATYRMERGSRDANVQSRIVLALSVVAEAGRVMLGEGEKFEVAGYAAARRIPVRFLNGIVEELVQAGLLAELADSAGCYALMRSPSSLRVKEVIDAVIRSGVKPEALGLAGVDPAIQNALRKTDDGISGSLQQLTVQDLLSDGPTSHPVDPVDPVQKLSLPE